MTSRHKYIVPGMLFLGALTLMAGCNSGGSAPDTGAAPEDPPEVTVGERLFLETRFAQFFAVNSGGNVNAPLAAGDPAVATLAKAGSASLPGPFAGQAMNCRQCHLVDDALGSPGGGMRTYGDFAVRSPLQLRTDRGDTATVAVRNSPPLVNAALPRDAGQLFHFDGEFTTLEDLSATTLTGRMLGWLPDEQAQAIAQVAKVIREDDGSGALAQQFGGAYKDVLAGRAAPDFALPAAFRVDVTTATDTEIVTAVAKLIAAYMRSLEFVRDEDGVFFGSPYDRFLVFNRLPRLPNFGESAPDYARRLRAALDRLGNPVYVGQPDAADGPRFLLHDQRFVFGPAELRGLRVFLADAGSAAPGGGVGNCIACHAPPEFTDFGLHNNGVAQREYDTLHGAGAFAALNIPALAQRNPATDLPATGANPTRQGRFRAVASAGDPALTDLGVWSVFANSDFPKPQATLAALLCPAASRTAQGCALGDAELLDLSIARFKTPGLRDLDHGAPFMHTGAFLTIENVLAFYQDSSALARAGTLRNGDAAIADVAFSDADRADLAAFLRALNEDYQ